MADTHTTETKRNLELNTRARTFTKYTNLKKKIGEREFKNG